MSSSPVTPFAAVLAERGLVFATPPNGFRARELSIEDIDDIVGLTESRVQIESMALRLAIERGDVLWETEVVATHHVLESTPVVYSDGRFFEPWALAHRDFHRALTAGCGNARLQEVVLGLRDGAELHRRWWWALTDHRQRDQAAEHRQLMDLTLARDADAAIECLTYHITRAPEQLIAYAHEHGVDDLNCRPWQAD